MIVNDALARVERLEDAVRELRAIVVRYRDAASNQEEHLSLRLVVMGIDVLMRENGIREAK